ncbi:MAG: membrane protein insertase YidC [Bacilli bacterium]|nr:membrane protein insertase YidC [Bacilli bacterium]
MIKILGDIMLFCYKILNNYGLAIILFTLISKIVLLPVSIWVQKNSIKMVKMQPDINKINIKYFGDKDSIADETSKLYKKEKYNALASLIPLFIQIVLLMGLVEVINHPLDYIVNVNSNETKQMITIMETNHPEVDKESSSKQLVIVEDIKDNKDYYNEIINEDKLKNIKDMKLSFLGMDLSWVAIQRKGIAWLIPLIAGLSALILCIGQNMMNVLQKEQTKSNQIGMLSLSVGLSLYLGVFVPAGVALYWTASNLLAIMQQWLLNVFINPKDYVDYEELESTSKELNDMINSTKIKRTKEEKKKEKEDYKKFFSIVNKHLVFYSESNGFYKYFKGIIEYILDNTNITIHYVTSDYKDNIFKLEKEYDNLKAYYIGDRKLITLMMKMDADVVVMTMPDLETFHIKRSYVRKDIEYIYLPHGMDSLNLTMRNHSMDHYDTVFVTGKYQREEAEKTNKVYKLKNRKIVDWGYSLLDEMINDYSKTKKKSKKEKTVLIAPSWQKDNIIDLCLDEMLEKLKGHDYKVIVRPHPQAVRHMKEKFDNLKEVYKNDTTVEIQTDFSSNDTVFNADLMITDWSGIAYEYAFTTKKPVLFINTPMKIMNEDYKKIKVEPFNIWCRSKIGSELETKSIKTIDKKVAKMLESSKEYNKKIDKVLNDSVYNIGESSEVGANYIIDAIQKKIKERKNK